MQKQHQLLSFLNEIMVKHNTIRTESKRFMANSANFHEFVRKYNPFDENDKDIPEINEKSMVTTVAERLKYDDKFIKSYINSLGKKELTNQKAYSDIVIYDEDTNEPTIICTNVPVTLLLELEKVVKQQLVFYQSIPTVDMNLPWKNGENNEGLNCYITNDDTKTRKITQKKLVSFDQNPKGSDKFPLVPQMVQEEVPVGTYTTITKSGCIKPRDKAKLCSKCEKLLIGIKSARAKANEQEVIDCNYGKDILDFLNSK